MSCLQHSRRLSGQCFLQTFQWHLGQCVKLPPPPLFEILLLLPWNLVEKRSGHQRNHRAWGFFFPQLQMRACRVISQARIWWKLCLCSEHWSKPHFWDSGSEISRESVLLRGQLSFTPPPYEPHLFWLLIISITNCMHSFLSCYWGVQPGFHFKHASSIFTPEISLLPGKVCNAKAFGGGGQCCYQYLLVLLCTKKLVALSLALHTTIPPEHANTFFSHLTSNGMKSSQVLSKFLKEKAPQLRHCHLQ